MLFHHVCTAQHIMTLTIPQIRQHNQITLMLQRATPFVLGKPPNGRCMVLGWEENLWKLLWFTNGYLRERERERERERQTDRKRERVKENLSWTACKSAMVKAIVQSYVMDGNVGLWLFAVWLRRGPYTRCYFQPNFSKHRSSAW